MNGLRSALRCVVAIALVAVVLPAAAADKLFALTAKTFTTSGASLGNLVPAGATQTVVLLDFKNQSPNQANSVFKSVSFTVPSDISFAVYSVQTVNNGTCSFVTPTASSNTNTTLNNLNGVKPGGHLCVWLAATTNATCTSSQWTGQANTGTNFGNGTPFTVDAAGTQPISTTQTLDGCTGVLGCDGGTTSGNNVAGPLGSLVFTDSAFAGSPGDWGLVRNTSGTCSPVPFNFSVDFNNNIANFTGVKPAGQTIAVEYVIQWAATAIATAGTDIDGNPLQGWTEGRPKVAWGFASQPPANAFTPALACLLDPVTPADITASVMPMIPAVEPFITLSATYPQYQPNTLAGMCIVQHGWTSKNGMVQNWDKVIDRSDGWVLPK